METKLSFGVLIAALPDLLWSDGQLDYQKNRYIFLVRFPAACSKDIKLPPRPLAMG
jgi:hypothetical protein